MGTAQLDVVDKSTHMAAPAAVMAVDLGGIIMEEVEAVEAVGADADADVADAAIHAVMVIMDLKAVKNANMTTALMSPTKRDSIMMMNGMHFLTT